MLTGERPFKGHTITAIIYQIVTEEVPDLEDVREDVPLDLVDLVYRMLEKDPMARIPSVRHIGAELEDILQGRTSQRPEKKRFETPVPEVFTRPKHNLPTPSTPFVGRETELTELTRLLSDPKLSD